MLGGRACVLRFLGFRVRRVWSVGYGLWLLGLRCCRLKIRGAASWVRFRVKGLGFRVIRVYECRVCRLEVLRFTVCGLRALWFGGFVLAFRVCGFGYGVWDLGCRM